MKQYGHMRELKEVRGVPLFLKQAAARTKCTVRLIQPDGKIIFQAYANGDPGCRTNVKHEKIVANWLSSAAPDQLQETRCSCGKPLLIHPITKNSRVDGMLTVCPFAERDRQFFSSLAAVISDNVVLARNAVREWEKHSTSISVQKELCRITERLQDPERICRGMLELLVSHFGADVGIFVPRNGDEAHWERPIIQDNSGHSEDWGVKLSLLVTAMYDDKRCPLLVGPETVSDYPEFEEPGVFSFMHTTVSHADHECGLLLFCSVSNDQVLSSDDLCSLQMLKSLNTQYFRYLCDRKSKERKASAILRKRAENMLKVIDAIVQGLEQNVDVFRISQLVSELKGELVQCHIELDGVPSQENALSLITLIEASLVAITWDERTRGHMECLRRALKGAFREFPVTYEDYSRAREDFREAGIETGPRLSSEALEALEWDDDEAE